MPARGISCFLLLKSLHFKECSKLPRERKPKDRSRGSGSKRPNPNPCTQTRTREPTHTPVGKLVSQNDWEPNNSNQNERCSVLGLTVFTLFIYLFFIHTYNFLFFLFFFPFIFISWSLITLQHCSGLCHTLTWISHGFTCVPHPDPPSHLPFHPIPLGLSSAPAPSTCLMHPTWAGDLFHCR